MADVTIVEATLESAHEVFDLAGALLVEPGGMGEGACVPDRDALLRAWRSAKDQLTSLLAERGGR